MVIAPPRSLSLHVIARCPHDATCSHVIASCGHGQPVRFSGWPSTAAFGEACACGNCQLPVSSRPTSSSRVLGGTAGKGAAVEMGVVVGSCRSPNRFSIWILSGAAAELVQCTNFIPNNESEKLLQIRTCFLIGWDRNPTIPRAQIPDDRLLLKTLYRTASRP